MHGCSETAQHAGKMWQLALYFVPYPNRIELRMAGMSPQMNLLHDLLALTTNC